MASSLYTLAQHALRSRDGGVVLTHLPSHRPVRPRSRGRSLPCASLIPRDTKPGEKYQAKVPSKVKDLSTADACWGPRGVMLFGFSENHAQATRRWLAEVEASLPVVPFMAAAEGADCSIDTLGDAIAVLEHAGGPGAAGSAPLAYAAAGAPALLEPAVLFSGLLGVEVIALLDVWSQYTGMARPAAGAALEATASKKVAFLLYEVVRAGEATAPSPSGTAFTVVGKSEPEEAENDEELRERVRQAVQKQQERRERKAAMRDAADDTLDSLRAGKKGGGGRGGASGFK